MMAINDLREYLAAKEYEKRLSYILADGSSFLRGDDLELFSASLRHELAQVGRAIEGYEAGMLLTRLTAPPPTFTRIKLQGGFGLLEQPSVLGTWSLPRENAGVFSALQELRIDPQLRLFTVGSYTEEPSVVYGPWLEPVGLAA